MKIELLIGMICSFKSGYTRERAVDGALTVNDDSIVMALHGGYYKGYREELKPIYKDFEYQIITTGRFADLDVVIDRPCFKKDTRQRYIQIAKSLDCDIEAILFPIEDYKIHAQRRYDNDNRGLNLETWQKIAYEHASQFEKVNYHEGFTRVINVTEKGKRYYPFG
jgi:hypothetical protein